MCFFIESVEVAIEGAGVMEWPAAQELNTRATFGAVKCVLHVYKSVKYLLLSHVV